MKLHYVIITACLLTAGVAFAFTKGHYTETKTAGAGSGFALIELYTSEGCSSCPPADKLAAKIAQEYAGKEVYVLAYHVDYWNRLGWKDVFSSPQYSARQNEYVQYLKVDGAYTPQAVVNGKTEFVGSDENKMRAAIQQSLAKSTAANLSLSGLKIGGGKATLNYKVSGTASGSNLLLAVIKNHAETQVKAGENSGRTLPHINIVQKLQIISLKADGGSTGLSLPDGFNSKDWSIIAFVQNTHNGEIEAVQKATPDGKVMAAVN